MSLGASALNPEDRNSDREPSVGEVGKQRGHGHHMTRDLGPDRYQRVMESRNKRSRSSAAAGRGESLVTRC